ncbi:MAG TPA: LptF/LptG family permease [Gemmatimonadales bacterium]
MRLLDRYVLSSWIKIFVLTAVGFPLVQVLLNATDRVARLLDRNLSAGTIALSYLYQLPESMSQMIPAATLFATVFTLGPLSRNSELTAVKAGGVSFHRILLPLIFAAVFASGSSFLIGEFSTRASARALELQKERRASSISVRYNFVYRGDQGWIYAVRLLDTQTQRMENVVFERAGTGDTNPTVSVVADSVVYVDTLPGRWRFLRGSTHYMGDSSQVLATFQFRKARLKALTQQPRELLVEAKDPSEMDYQELGDYIETLRRSGNDVRKLKVEQAIKVAVPVACFIIALFGGPLAMTAPRAGAAVGVAISLGTTVSYLMLINLTRAVGASGLMNPTLAAWTPNILFFVVAIILLIKVRT